MLHQVKVSDNQCSFLRFLWQDRSDTSNKAVDFEMVAHVFRGSSPPSFSNFALRKTTTDNKDLYSKEASKILERNFYVKMPKSF